MVSRLVVDSVRRDKWQFLIWVIQIGNFSRSVGFSAKVLNPLAFAMVGSLFLAAISSLGLGHRSILQLPISRRTWWLARWWKDAAVVPIVALLAAMGGAATGAGPALSIEQGASGFSGRCCTRAVGWRFWQHHSGPWPTGRLGPDGRDGRHQLSVWACSVSCSCLSSSRRTCRLVSRRSACRGRPRSRHWFHSPPGAISTNRRASLDRV